MRHHSILLHLASAPLWSQYKSKRRLQFNEARAIKSRLQKVLKRQYPSIFTDKKQKRDHNYLQAQIGFAAKKSQAQKL